MIELVAIPNRAARARKAFMVEAIFKRERKTTIKVLKFLEGLIGFTKLGFLDFLARRL